MTFWNLGLLVYHYFNVQLLDLNFLAKDQIETLYVLKKCSWPSMHKQ